MKNKAFSLVELSIVLVILGLLVGGVLGGQALIRSSELRTILTDRDKIVGALHTFKNKYQALPGDMPNAVRFWGAQAGATTDGMDATCAALTAAATGTATCNGDGDGKMGDWHNAAEAYEWFRIWQHLSNAGLIEGSYTGVTGSLSSWDFVAGQNVPANKTGGGINIVAYGTMSGDPSHFDGNYGHSIGISRRYAGTANSSGLLTPEESWSLDTKSDDGRASSGTYYSSKSTDPINPGCTTTADPTTATYALSTKNAVCVVNIKLGF